MQMYVVEEVINYLSKDSNTILEIMLNDKEKHCIQYPT